MQDAPTSQTLNVLFLCTGNTARSVIAEALLRHLGRGRFNAYSAGSHPKGHIHPRTLELLAAKGIDASGFRSKNWDEFARADVPMDIIITVCDNAAGEMCPVWPGRPTTAHWGVADPAAVSGSEEDERRAFERAYEQLRRHIEKLVALSPRELQPASLRHALEKIHSDAA